MSATRKSAAAVVAVALLLGGPSVARAQDTYTGGSSFSAEKKIKAAKSPALRSSLSVPSGMVQGDQFQLNCVVTTLKNKKGKALKGATGSLALFAYSLDVGSRTWEFFGLVGSGLPFTTDKTGMATVDSGPITAGAWANDAHPVNDVISVTAQFTNNKRVVSTELECEMVAVDEAP